MKSVLFLHVLYLIFIKSFVVKGATKWGSQIEMRAVLLSCPPRDNGCEENDFLSQLMDAEQQQLVKANGKNYEILKEKRMREFPQAIKDCKRKLVITMKVKNSGKVPCEDKYIVVDHVYDPVTQSRGRLLSPVVLKLRQEQMVQLYGLQFQRVVNTDPYEQEISGEKFCSVSSNDPTCGIALYNGKPIPFSEGFCCSCNPQIDSKEQVSPASHEDSFTYRDPTLVPHDDAQKREVEPIITNPELIQLRSKKSYDYTKTDEKYLKLLNSDKLPNFLLEKDRKIICDKGDFMNELCKLRQEKNEANERNTSYVKERSLKEKNQPTETLQMAEEKSKVQTAMSQASMPINPNGKLTLSDATGTLNAETMSQTEFKGSRGKRENRYEIEDNSLEKDLERFIKAKKLHRNRRKRLFEISHKQNHKEGRYNPRENGENGYSDEYVKPLPPMFFFSHDKLVLNPLETPRTNNSNTPVENAYDGMKYALQKNRFDTKRDKNGRKSQKNFERKAYKGQNSNERYQNSRENMQNRQQFEFTNREYEKEQIRQFETDDDDAKWKKETVKQRTHGHNDETSNYLLAGNSDKYALNNYLMGRNKGYPNPKQPQDRTFDEEGKDIKDYSVDSRPQNEGNTETNYNKALLQQSLGGKMGGFNAHRKKLEKLQMQNTPQMGNYEPTDEHIYAERKFIRPTDKKHSPLFKHSKSEENENEKSVDFKVEITNQNIPALTKPLYAFHNSGQSQSWKPRFTQLNSKQRHEILYEPNRIHSQLGFYYPSSDVRRPNIHLKDANWAPLEHDRNRLSVGYYKKKSNFVEGPTQYSKWVDKRPSQAKYVRRRMDDYSNYVRKSGSSQDVEEQQIRGEVRERRSVKEFEPAKGHVVSDKHSETDATPTETVRKAEKTEVININEEILSGLPKLREKVAKLDKNKLKRSLKTNMDRLIQSYLNAPDYVLSQIESENEKQSPNESTRNSTCSLEGEYKQETAHCMRYGDLWYSMYSIKQPVAAQIVGLQLFEKRTLNDGTTRWKDLTKGKMIRVGTLLSPAEDELPVISLTFREDKASAVKSPFEPDKYVLLVPSHLSDPSKANFYPQLEGGPGEYLLVNKEDISSSGECSKIGTSFEAFARQPKRCLLPRGSCLKRQPVDLWREDMEARIRGKRGKYFIENFGRVPNSPIKTFTNLTGEYLAMEYFGDYSSTIEVELKADNNFLIRKGRSTAQIPTVLIDCTYPKITRIFMTVLNSGLTTSRFRPRLGGCSPDLDPLSCPLEGPPVTIPPQKRHDFKLNLSGTLPSENMHAIVQVLNQENQPIAQRKIRIKRGERCMCAFNCKCNCVGEPEKGKTCKKLSDDEYRAAGYMGSPPYRARPASRNSFVKNIRLVVISTSYILLMFGVMKGVVGSYFRSIGIAGVRILTGPKTLPRYFEPDLRGATVIYDEFGFPIHPTTFQPVQMVPLYMEFMLNIVFFFLYPLMGFWLILKNSVCLKIEFGESCCRHDRDSDSSPLLTRQNTTVNYNLMAVPTKKCPTDEYLPYLSYRCDNDPLEDDDTEFVLQEMKKHKTK